MSITKRYLKSNQICKVTFRIPPEIGINYKTAYLLGNFNNWDSNSHRMKKLVKDGSFSIIINLESNKEYEFKYFIDNKIWLNDPDADQLVDTEYEDSKNSLIII